MYLYIRLCLAKNTLKNIKMCSRLKHKNILKSLQVQMLIILVSIFFFALVAGHGMFEAICPYSDTYHKFVLHTNIEHGFLSFKAKKYANLKVMLHLIPLTLTHGLI